ncbi:cobyrinate a,c-diamide synthase [Motilibacter deserti]|uniref:Hydrogenobyrinate a,c-diamide synthase n=1 Tax=Motilibacter deserti TaxID=2714956 RepID=A0ABX0GSF5_9ACTN|nr:cobyrinate a,c-diamide synthase [Motilibacter deserti]
MSSGSVPRFVVAAPSSGHGKTTVATGLLAAFAGRGLAVSPHKVGPDYIDPGYHGLAAGRVGRNLDAYLCGPERIVPLFLHGAAGADLAIVEGVMGLYDGATGHGELASTAHVAKLLRAPVILVVDPKAQGRSAAALVHGFATFDPDVRIGGVILNRVGSERHEEIVREALDEIGVPVLGCLPPSDAISAPSRHLGLVPVAERSAASVATVRALGELVSACVDLEGVLEVARTAGGLSDAAWDPRVAIGDPVAGRPRIAVAAGAAFTFSYAETSELLTAAGAEVVHVDPLRDEALPEGTAGLVVGGGFPEMYASELSANEPLRAAVSQLAASGAPVAAECAGLLYLAKSLDGQAMCGVIDVDARMTGNLSLGYRDAVAVSDNALAVEGQRVRGHEFHRTACSPPAGPQPAWQWRAEAAEGFVQGGVHASYLHVHWAGAPQLARRFTQFAARLREAA